MGVRSATRIWNRAAMDGGGTAPREGDLALAALLDAHGMAMNGGMGHVIEVLGPDEVAAAARGYRFFALDAAADVLVALHDGQVGDADVDRRYHELVPSDATLVARFEAVLASRPDAFAPCEVAGAGSPGGR